MCGRYNAIDWGRIGAEVQATYGVELPTAKPRYNVAPSQLMPILATEADGQPRGALMRWGLVPFWEKSAKPKLAPINARSEEAMSKPMFKQGIQRRRCLIPATGFYEWKKLPDGSKQPYEIGLRGRPPIFFAGIHEPATELHPETFLLFTTGPNALMTDIHDRMPVIITIADGHRWLKPGPMEAATFASLTVPHPAEAMDARPVSRLVNTPKHDGPEIFA